MNEQTYHSIQVALDHFGKTLELASVALELFESKLKLCDVEPINTASELLALVEEVEWCGYDDCCIWCKGMKPAAYDRMNAGEWMYPPYRGHKPDCRRQATLAKVRGASQ